LKTIGIPGTSIFRKSYPSKMNTAFSWDRNRWLLLSTTIELKEEWELEGSLIGSKKNGCSEGLGILAELLGLALVTRKGNKKNRIR